MGEGRKESTREGSDGGEYRGREERRMRNGRAEDALERIRGMEGRE